jgi:NADPH:quinone reductase
VLAPAIGGSVGNAVTQLAKALGARHAISTTTSHAKAERAREMGFSEIVDLSAETLTAGVTRLTGAAGADVVIDSIGGDILGEALGVMARGGTLITLGYAGGRNSMIDVTDLIWKGASVRGFLLFSEPPSAWQAGWQVITTLLRSNAVTPVVAKVFPLEEACEALRYLTEDRPFGRVILKL